MTDQIKNRVVGAVVLFALAIIFLPKIFDGEKESQRREFVSIPKKPQHQQPAIKQLNVGVAVDESVKDTLSDSQQNKPRPLSNSKPKVIAAPVVVASPAIKAKAWVIRMGSFGNPQNVKSFVVKLRKKGFSAFSVPTTPRAGITNKVYVGPELNKHKLVSLQPKLKQSFNESGVIERYHPIK